MKQRKLIYEPQQNATPDEVLQVLKVFTFATYPKHMQTNELLFSLYDTLPPNAQRHFRVVEEV